MTKENKTYLVLAISAVVIWHIIISASGNKKITGPFSAVPKPGYAWIDGSNGSHYFWNTMKAEWKSGIIHPKYKVISSFIKNSWIPLAGYAYRSGTDLSTIYWQPGLSHPNYKVVSAMTEGQWLPLLGYQFKSPPTSSLEVVWQPGLNYNALKIVSGNQPDEFFPYPGYELPKDGNIYKGAKWKEGLFNPNNNELISGEDEGEWVSIDNLFEDANYGINVSFKGCDYTGLTKLLYRSYVALNPAANKIESIFQKNLLEGSRAVMEEFLGGMPIAGRIKITKNYLEYEPNEYSNWFISGDNIKEFRIPATDIKFVSRDYAYSLGGIITVKTEFATFKFIKESRFPWESPGSTIREKIDLMLQYNHIRYE